MRIYEPGWPRDDKEAARTREIVERVTPFTMVPVPGVEAVIRAVAHVTEEGIPGDFVECGVWQGGCAAAMHLAEPSDTGERRILHLFDSFEGLPDAQAIDGPLAAAFQADPASPANFDNCTASLEQVQQNFQTLGILDDSVRFHRGWFDQTLPVFAAASPSPIAVLRLDGDWYESTKVCLEQLYPLVSDGGVILIDDYYWWDGCAAAVHEYLGTHLLKPRIRSVDGFWGAYLVKQDHRDNWRA